MKSGSLEFCVKAKSTGLSSGISVASTILLSRHFFVGDPGFSDEEKLPSSYDGIEQLGSLIKSIKS